MFWEDESWLRKKIESESVMAAANTTAVFRAILKQPIKTERYQCSQSTKYIQHHKYIQCYIIHVTIYTVYYYCMYYYYIYSLIY